MIGHLDDFLAEAKTFLEFLVELREVHLVDIDMAGLQSLPTQ